MNFSSKITLLLKIFVFAMFFIRNSIVFCRASNNHLFQVLRIFGDIGYGILTIHLAVFDDICGSAPVFHKGEARCCQKKSPLVRRPMLCRSYIKLNLLTN